MTTERSRVTVVIPCFNHGEFLREAVASVLDGKRSDIELLVVDDGSTDERTRELMDVLAREGIRVVRQENRGLSAARNAGVRVSEGEYVFPLDADDRLRDGWIDRAIEVLEERPEVGIVYGDAQFFGVWTHRWTVGPIEPELLLEKNQLPASALFRRSVWEQNGGYDETMLQGYEDWEFWIAALERGWKFAYIEEVVFEYRKAKESMLTRVAQFEGANADYVAKKHGPLYRQALLSTRQSLLAMKNERESVKATVRELRRLLGLRLKKNLGGSVEQQARK